MDEITYEDVIEMLEDIKEGIDYDSVTTLWDDHYIDSFDLIAIVNAADEEFDITIPAKDIIPANVNSARAIHEMLVRLADED